MTEYFSAQPYTEEERERDDALKRMSYGRWSLRRLLRPSRKAALQSGNAKKTKKRRSFKAQPWWLED